MPIEVWYDPSQLHSDELLGVLVSRTSCVGIINRYPVRRSAVPYEAIELYADNDRTLRVFVKDADLDIIDLTGATAVFTMKETKQSTIPSVQKSTAVPAQGQIGAADEGEVLFFILPADTASLDIRQYVFDVEVTLASGKAYTVLEGTINLLQPVG